MIYSGINALGSWVHKWNEECDEDLYRLMCYVYSSLERRQYAWVGNEAHEISPHLYADADFAGCNNTSRSTTGVHLCLKGSHTYFPMNGVSKKQDAVSHSTPEAEIVAAAFAIRREGLPSTYLWETLLQHPKRPQGDPIEITFHEDNQTMIRVCETGRNPTNC